MSFCAGTLVGFKFTQLSICDSWFKSWNLRSTRTGTLRIFRWVNWGNFLWKMSGKLGLWRRRDLVEVQFSLNHMCVRVKTPAPSVSVNKWKCLCRSPVEVWIVWGLSWEEGSECKWQQNISFFCTINSSSKSCSRAVGFEEASDAAWLFTAVFYTINSLSEADLMIPSHNCLFHFSLLIFIFENIFNKNI